MKQLNWYQIFGKSNIPDGRTVLPTDDIQIWLHCANIWNKTYTTLAEVLADTDTLLALINSPNAVDYMVRSTTWAVSTSVPVMTSNTTPSGVCSSSSIYNTGFEAYKAFDGDDTTRAAFSGNDTDRYIQYDFGTSVVVDHVGIKPLMTTGSTVKTFKVSSSVDGVTFADIATLTHDNTDNYSTYDIHRTVSRCFRVNIIDNYATAPTYYNVCTLQFYSTSVTDNATAMSYIGLNNYCANTLLADSTWCNAICNSEYFESVLNVKVPKMTSNTTPSGVCSADLSYEGQPYYAFDGNDNTRWYGYGSAVSGWMYHGVQYDFGYPVKVYKISVTLSPSGASTITHATSIYGSADNVSFTKVKDFPEWTGTGLSDKATLVETVPNASAYRYFRCYSVRTNPVNPQNPSAYLYGVQFYGRADV